MKEKHEAKTSRDDVTLRHEEEKDEGGAAGKKRRFLTKKEAEARLEEAASKDVKHYRETEGENVTNVPLRPTTNTKELNRDKEHTVTKVSSCHSLIKQLGATEHKAIHLDKNTVQTVEMNTKPFSTLTK